MRQPHLLFFVKDCNLSIRLPCFCQHSQVVLENSNPVSSSLLPHQCNHYMAAWSPHCSLFFVFLLICQQKENNRQLRVKRTGPMSKHDEHYESGFDHQRNSSQDIEHCFKDIGNTKFLAYSQYPNYLNDKRTKSTQAISLSSWLWFQPLYGFNLIPAGGIVIGPKVGIYLAVALRCNSISTLIHSQRLIK